LVIDPVQGACQSAQHAETPREALDVLACRQEVAEDCHAERI
jgi:hypothetical protein